jgi:ABC-type transport system substrate-binding protein
MMTGESAGGGQSMDVTGIHDGDMAARRCGGLTRREMLKLGAIGAAAGVGLTPSAAIAADRPSGTLRVAYSFIGPNRHPGNLGIIPDDDIANTMYEGILTLSPELAIRPALAESFRQIDSTRFRFTLRSGVRFHDGSPVTAEDAKGSIEGFLRTKDGAGARYLYAEWLDRVEVKDRLTFEVVTKKPFRPALSNMAYESYLTPKSADPGNPSVPPPGTGPYKFVEFIPNDRVVVEANPNYWGPNKAAFQTIVFRRIPEDATRLAALEAGEIDFATNVPPDAIGRLRTKGFKVESRPTTRVMFLTFNFGLPGPWHDVRVRQALNYAIDKQAILRAMFGGMGGVSVSSEPAGIRFVNRNLTPYGFDPGRAKQLLAEAGLPNGFQGGTLVAPAGRFLKDKEVAEVVQSQLAAVGARYELLTLQYATFRAEAKKYPLGLGAWGNLTGDPAAGNAQQLGYPLFPFNFAGWEAQSPALGELAEQGNMTFEEGKLGNIYARLQETIWSGAPRIFLVDVPTIVAYSPRFLGFTQNPNEEIRWNLVRREGA